MDAKESTINHYEPGKNNGAFIDKYVKHKSKGDENISINLLQRQYSGNMINELMINQVSTKFI